MSITGFDDLLSPQGSVTDQVSTDISVRGEPVTVEEVAGRLSPGLYAQLSNGSSESVTRAASRATVRISAIAARCGRVLDLDNTVMREIVLNMTIYEMHMALGHEEAGKEYRVSAKDLIVATFGDYPEAGREQDARAPVAAVQRPQRKPFP